MHQVFGKIDFIDSLIVTNPKINKRLDKINKLIDWKSLKRILESIYSSKTGRPSYPLIVLFKCLLLQT